MNILSIVKMKIIYVRKLSYLGIIDNVVSSMPNVNMSPCVSTRPKPQYPSYLVSKPNYTKCDI
jgi:hypothetical protein